MTQTPDARGTVLVRVPSDTANAVRLYAGATGRRVAEVWDAAWGEYATRHAAELARELRAMADKLEGGTDGH